MINDLSKFFLIIIFFFLSSNIAKAEKNIVFVDVDYIYINSIAGKKINKQILEKNEKINNEISDFKKKIGSKEKKLISQKNVLADEEFKKKYAELTNELNEFNQNIKIKREKNLEFQKKSKLNFLKELTLILGKFSDDNSIDFIMKKENIVIAKNNLDITSKILDLFNNKIKAIKIE